MVTEANQVLNPDDPQPGVYRGVPMAVYRATHAVNVSKLKHGRRTMAHLEAHLRDPDDDGSAATDFGEAGHMAILEPDRFADLVLVGGPINPKTEKCYGRDSNKWEEYAKANPGRILLSEDDHLAILKIQAGIMGHPLARKLLHADGPCEAVLIWKDADTGIVCKARLDKFIPGVVAADLKTCLDAGEDAFGYALWKHGYYLQVPWYMDGILATTGEEMPLPLVAMEKTAPHLCAVHLLDPDDIEQGRLENRAILTKMAEAERTGEWKGYPDTLTHPRIPKFHRTRGVQGAWQRTPVAVGAGLRFDDEGADHIF